MGSEDQKKKPLRCAVIGLGMGRNHARTFLEYKDSELVAVVDMDPARLAHFKDVVGPDALFTDYEEMLKELAPDLVMVALPNFLHKPVTLAALESGSHVLCEKPMAMTVAEAEDMLAAARASGKKLGINFSQRFSPQHRAMEKIAQSGALGEVYHAYCSWTRRDGFPGFGGWFGQQKMSGGGPLIDLGVHRIDRSLSLMGHPTVKSVFGATHKRIGVPRAGEQAKAFDVEDFAAGCVRFTNGASLLFEVSWAGHMGKKEDQQMRIVGTKGALESSNGTFHHYNISGVPCSAEIHTDTVQGRNSCEEMVHCLLHDEPFAGQPEDGIQVQRILNGLYESAETGREVVYE